jgi:hypothetical protein
MKNMEQRLEMDEESFPRECLRCREEFSPSYPFRRDLICEDCPGASEMTEMDYLDGIVKRWRVVNDEDDAIQTKEADELRERVNKTADWEFWVEETEKLRKQITQIQMEGRVIDKLQTYENKIADGQRQCLRKINECLMEALPYCLGIYREEDKTKEVERKMNTSGLLKLEQLRTPDGQTYWERTYKNGAVDTEPIPPPKRKIIIKKPRIVSPEPEMPDDRESTALWRSKG